ncbi:telomere-protecting terminal protein Tpg [Kitasatospora sp. NPDC094028]
MLGRTRPPATWMRAALETGGTKALAARLGVSQRTVQRYRAGTVTKPRTAAREALQDETCEHWQEDVRAQVREHAANSGGLTIETRARFGFDAGAGTSDDPRRRQITQHVSPAHAAAIIAAREAGADEEQLTDLVAEALADAYFHTSGPGAIDLRVAMSDIEYIDFAFH